MLHALLQSGGHPRAKFLDRCRGVVSCASGCTREAGPPPAAPADAAVILPSELQLELVVEPGAPSASDDDGHFGVTVSARNVAGHPVVVRLHDDPDRLESTLALALRIRSTDGWTSEGAFFVTSFDAGDLVFRPGETKRQVFDFRIGQDAWTYRPPPGEYEVRPGFGERWGAWRKLVIR
jgi:hypothetical protein